MNIYFLYIHKKLKLIYIYIFFFILHNNYPFNINHFLDLSLLSTHKNTKEKKNSKNIHHGYGHEKFCKKINFYYYITIDTQNEKEILTVSILLMNNEEHEQEIIFNNETLLNKSQWHCYLTNNNKIILPKTILKKEIDLHDINQFGAHHIPFGNLFIISFENTERFSESLLFNINQYNKEFLICLQK